MCRLRISKRHSVHWQFAAVADLAERYGGGYTHVTTRAKLADPRDQGRAWPRTGRRSCGYSASRRAARAPTTSATSRDRRRRASIRQELIDTRPYAKAVAPSHSQFAHALWPAAQIQRRVRRRRRDPDARRYQRYFVYGGDGGRRGQQTKPDVWFRLGLGGITGHKDFARPTGVYVKPEDATRVADAIVRVFIDQGDRTDRKKARLKYVLDDWGFEKFVSAVEARLGDAADAIRP